MDYFYLTTNTGRKEPDAISAVSYLHVKAKSDGSQTLVICEQEINDPNVAEKTQSEAQAILYQWISDENLNPEIDVDGNEIIQKQINLGDYL